MYVCMYKCVCVCEHECACAFAYVCMYVYECVCNVYMRFDTSPKKFFLAVLLLYLINIPCRDDSSEL